MAAEEETTEATGSVFTLDLDHRRHEEPLAPEALELAGKTFVEIELAEVVNWPGVRLTFDVLYRPEEGDEIPLGTFALFPPDRPGRFLVATGGKASGPGSLVLEMKLLDEPEAGAVVEVGVARFALIPGEAAADER